MLVIAVLDNSTLQVIHYTGEDEDEGEQLATIEQKSPPPAEEDSVWNRLTGVLGGTDDAAECKSKDRTHDPPPAEDSIWNTLTGVLRGTDDTAEGKSRKQDPPPAEESVWSRLTGVLGSAQDTTKDKSCKQDPPPAEESLWNTLTGVLGGSDDTAEGKHHTQDPPPSEESMWSRLTGVLGGTDDTTKDTSRKQDPPPAEESVWNTFTGVLGGADDTEHQKHESHARDERTRGGGMAVREQTIKIDVKAQRFEVLKYPARDNLKLYPPDEAIKRARSRLDEKEYGLFQNNCECFVNWAITGESISNQVESGKWATALGATVGALSGYWKEGSFTAAAKGAMSGAQDGFQHYRENRY